MVASINNGAQVQIPAATTFKPGDNNVGQKNSVSKQDNLLQNKQVSASPGENLKLTEPTKTEQLNSKTLLARDNFRADTDNSGSRANRGSTLDISV